MVHTPRTDRGFMMVALLVGMAVAAIWMTAMLPSWRQQVQRTKEEDLIFRGEQYARAIALFQLKNRGALPPSIDVLVSQHFLRKKWKDPVTNDDFQPVGIGIVALPGQSTSPQAGQIAAPQPAGSPAGRAGRAGGAPISGSQQPGVSGVRSQSTATSIKVYQNQQQYNLWQFDGALYAALHGMQVQGANQQGGRQGGQPGAGRGGQPGGGAAGPGGARGGTGPGRGGTGTGPGRGGAPPPPTGGRGRGGN